MQNSESTGGRKRSFPARFGLDDDLQEAESHPRRAQQLIGPYPPFPLHTALLPTQSGPRGSGIYASSELRDTCRPGDSQGGTSIHLNRDGNALGAEIRDPMAPYLTAEIRDPRAPYLNAEIRDPWDLGERGLRGLGSIGSPQENGAELLAGFPFPGSLDAQPRANDGQGGFLVEAQEPAQLHFERAWHGRESEAAAFLLPVEATLEARSGPQCTGSHLLDPSSPLPRPRAAPHILQPAMAVRGGQTHLSATASHSALPHGIPPGVEMLSAGLGQGLFNTRPGEETPSAGLGQGLFNTRSGVVIPSAHQGQALFSRVGPGNGEPDSGSPEDSNAIAVSDPFPWVGGELGATDASARSFLSELNAHRQRLDNGDVGLRPARTAVSLPAPSSSRRKVLPAAYRGMLSCCWVRLGEDLWNSGVTLGVERFLDEAHSSQSQQQRRGVPHEFLPKQPITWQESSGLAPASCSGATCGPHKVLGGDRSSGPLPSPARCPGWGHLGAPLEASSCPQLGSHLASCSASQLYQLLPRPKHYADIADAPEQKVCRMVGAEAMPNGRRNHFVDAADGPEPKLCRRGAGPELKSSSRGGRPIDKAYKAPLVAQTDLPTVSGKVQEETKHTTGSFQDPPSLRDRLAAAVDAIESKDEGSGIGQDAAALQRRPSEGDIVRWDLAQLTGSQTQRQRVRGVLLNPAMPPACRLNADWGGALPNLTAAALFGQSQPARELLPLPGAAQPGHPQGVGVGVLAGRRAPGEDHSFLASQVLGDHSSALLKRLLLSAEALEQKNGRLFESLLKQLKPCAKQRGSAVERVLHYMLQALVLRAQGEGFSFVSTPLKRTFQEMDNCRMWYYTSSPICPFGSIAITGALLPKLRGHSRVHIIDLGQAMIPQWPVVMRLLAAPQNVQLGSANGSRTAGTSMPGGCCEAMSMGCCNGSRAGRVGPTPRSDLSPRAGPGVMGVGESTGYLRRLRITHVDSSLLANPGRTDITAVKAATRVGRELGKAAEALGIAFEYESIHLSDSSMDDLDVIQRGLGEALVVSCCYDLKNFTEDVAVGGGALQKLLKCFRRLRPEVIAVSEVDQEASYQEFVPRFRAALDHHMTIFDFHDAIAMEAKRKLLHGFEDIFWGRDICSIVGCEGIERRMRPHSAPEWIHRFVATGLRAVPLGASVEGAARDLLKCYPDGFGLREDLGALRMTWRGTPFVAAFSLAA